MVAMGYSATVSSRAPRRDPRMAASCRRVSRLMREQWIAAHRAMIPQLARKMEKRRRSTKK